MGSTKGDIINSKGIRNKATGCTTDLLRVPCRPRVTMPMVGEAGEVQQEAYLRVYLRRWHVAVAWIASFRERNEIENLIGHVLEGHN